MSVLRKSMAHALRQWSKIDKSSIPFVAPYEHAHHDVVSVPVANIATDLGPKLNQALKKGSRLCVIGYDGATLAKSGYVWREKLAHWLKKGCSVDYFLHTPRREAIDALGDLKRRLPAGSGRLRVFRPKRDKLISPKLNAEVSEFRTFHFAVSEKPSTLWIEANHQTSEPKAFDCYFFPEKAAVETGLAESYQRRFDELVGNACVSVRLSAKTVKAGKKKHQPKI